MDKHLRVALCTVLAAGCGSSSKSPSPPDADASADSGMQTSPDAGGEPVDDGTPVLGQTVQVVQTSRAGDKWTDKGTLPVVSGGTNRKVVVTIDADETRQTILGFGGAITESSATVLAALPEAKRQEVIDAYFAPEGAGYTLARTHIASCDFSVAPYQYALEADPTLPDFSIEHDRAALIPVLKQAVTAAGGALKIVAAPWSAPAWMKQPAELYIKPAADNGYRGVDPVLRPEYLDAYALYLTKYLQAYAAEGLDVWGLSPQNEPLGNGGNWETMRWDPVKMRDFIRDKLGPALETAELDTRIMIFDHNKGAVEGDAVRWTKVILGDANAAKYVWGTAIHWYASTFKVFEDSLDAIHEVDPTKAILATEATIDGLTDRKAMAPSPAYQDSWLGDEFYWTKSAYDWGYWWATGSARDDHPVYEPVYRYARDIIVGLNHWYVGWIDWNVVLDQTGGPNHEKNLCAAPVMIDAEKGEIFYSPLYYVMGHFSKFIRPDAVVLTSEVSIDDGVSTEGYDGKRTDGLLAAAAKNTDGSYVTVLFNETAAELDYSLVLGDTSARGTIAPQALQTVVWTGRGN